VAAVAAGLLAFGASAQTGDDFDLPEQPLSDSLRAIASRTHANILFDRALVAGRRAPALKLHATLQRALEEILRGTGLSYRAIDDKTITIVATPISKQSVSHATAPPAADASASRGLEEVVVTAERRAVDSQSVAASVSALTAAMLDQSKIWNAADLQRYIPGLLVSNNGAYGQPYLRGVGSDIINPGADSPIAVFVDGVYQARQTAALTDLFDMDRVEVLKGPQGTLYGRNASGGAINLVTSEPQPRFQESGDLYFGSNNTLHVRDSVNTPITDEASLRVAALISRRDGYTLNLTDGSRINDESVWALRSRLKYVFSELCSVIFGIEYTHENDSRNSANKLLDSPALPLPVRDLAARFAFPALNLPADPLQVRYDYLPEIYVAQLRLNLTARWRWDTLELLSITGYTHLDDVAVNDLDATAISFAYDRESDLSKALSQTLQFSAPHWMAGLEYFQEQGGQNFDARLPPFGPPSPIPLGPDSPVPGFVWASTLRTLALAGFADGNLQLAQNWTLNAGFRYSWEQKTASLLQTVLDPRGELTGVAGTAFHPAHPERSFSAWTPKLRVEYRPAPALLLYLSATRGFKSGGFNLMNTGETFLPETLWSYESGLKASWLNNRLRTNASAFYYDYRDLQVNQFSGVTNLVTNAATSRISGLELELAALPTRWLQAQISLAWLDARYRSYLTRDANRPNQTIDLSGNQMPHAPRATVTTSLESEIPLRHSGTLKLRAEARYQSLMYFDQFDTPQLAQGGYSLFNAHLQYIPGNHAWSLELVGENLSDKIYRQSVVRVDSVFGTELSFGAPRTLGVRFATHF
jgi:iron complex outermembrane receptor protein